MCFDDLLVGEVKLHLGRGINSRVGRAVVAGAGRRAGGDRPVHPAGIFVDLQVHVHVGADFGKGGETAAGDDGLEVISLVPRLFLLVALHGAVAEGVAVAQEVA